MHSNLLVKKAKLTFISITVLFIPHLPHQHEHHFQCIHFSCFVFFFILPSQMSRSNAVVLIGIFWNYIISILTHFSPQKKEIFVIFGFSHSLCTNKETELLCTLS